MSISHKDLLFLLEEHGIELTYTHGYDSVYDTDLGISSQSEEPYYVTGYFFDYKLQEIDEENILRGDRKLLISVEDIYGAEIDEPVNGDIFEGHGNKVSVKSVTKILSRSNILCYICQVRA